MSKMNRTQAKEHARVLRVASTEMLASGLECWQGQPDMIAMQRGDCKDYRAIATLLREFKIEEARSLSGSLDTAARECIPDSVWNAMEEHLEDDEEYEESTAARIEILTERKADLDRQLAAAHKAHDLAQRREQHG